jgi:hypothetical protein
MKDPVAFLVLLFLLSYRSFSQSAADAAVQLSASVQNNPAEITLSWPGNSTTSQYQVFRKLKSDVQWGPLIASLAGNVTQYVDTVTIGISYEYQVVRAGTNYTGFGYINSGIEIPPTEYRGKVILIVDSTYIAPLASELKRLISDLEGDGWDVIRHDVLRTGSVKHVKELIVNDYAVDSSDIKAVFLVGHVPVPYSGNINPDGHPDHLGAWPADCYYGDVDGVWTDLYVTSTTNSPVRTQNVPGDGKFDQSVIPSSLELQVGRADFSNLPAFSLSEQQLLKNYLDKDHDYRKKIYSPLKRAVIDDNFGYFSGEAFAASGYKNFGPLVGSANITTPDYFTSMASGSYQWSFGCGGGSYTSAGGIGTTGAFATASLQGVFTMLFGSYFGDWDSQDNFLRAPLAQGRILTNVWSGRPHYQFHHMGLGETIGYGLITTQNNPGNSYFASPTGITGKWVHNALMGDPTLRNDVVAPVANVVATKVGYNCEISWTASTETNIAGYNIYMKNDTNNFYVKINALPIAGTTYTDICLLYKGVYSYMVRTLKLETTPSGTYFNLSEGLSDTAYNSSTIRTYASFTNSVTANNVSFSNTSINGNAAFWNFGNGVTSTSLNPVVTYTANGSYYVKFVSINGCHRDSTTAIININEVGISELFSAGNLRFYPNPSKGSITVVSDEEDRLEIEIFTAEGRMVYGKTGIIKGKEIDLGSLSRGIYLLKISGERSVLNTKLVLE